MPERRNARVLLPSHTLSPVQFVSDLAQPTSTTTSSLLLLLPSLTPSRPSSMNESCCSCCSWPWHGPSTLYILAQLQAKLFLSFVGSHGEVTAARFLHTLHKVTIMTSLAKFCPSPSVYFIVKPVFTRTNMWFYCFLQYWGTLALVSPLRCQRLGCHTVCGVVRCTNHMLMCQPMQPLLAGGLR